MIFPDRRITELLTIGVNEMQSTSRLFVTSLAVTGWRLIKRKPRVPIVRFWCVLLSLPFAIASTTFAQTAVPQTADTEQTAKVDATQVVIMVPNVSCYGRFHDSLKEHLQGKHGWIHSVNIRNTEKVRNPGKSHVGASEVIHRGELPFDIGTIAELTVTIDSSKSTLDLLNAIRDSKRFSLKRWTVQVEIPIEELLSR